ncbi:protein KINESIN LIGHT CHAIN-RELATED 1 [Prunus yedoensis var. nudiflora]|uniref:Protein KINESIN LIGHT CHAIN-RELATED 1 n=1 Tax=Prunus yedoensis var. nudiflora TaxID=2094558 RepID=A0A314UYE8_PRUYE|nr:protein KINESIN LIGHT CHAIN-RELATED 1 [Prunus yedoensis var. nudiflora]
MPGLVSVKTPPDSAPLRISVPEPQPQPQPQRSEPAPISKTPSPHPKKPPSPSPSRSKPSPTRSKKPQPASPTRFSPMPHSTTRISARFSSSWLETPSPPAKARTRLWTMRSGPPTRSSGAPSTASRAWTWR